MRKPATLQRRGPEGPARPRLRSAQGCVRLGAARRQRGLKGMGCGGAVKRPERLLSSGRLRAAAADQPAARARMEGTEGGVAPLGASAPRARTRLMNQTAPPRSRAAWRANLAKSGCVPKGVPKAWAARWRGGGAERRGQLRACTTGPWGMYEAVLRGGRVHTASARARASQTHARITPFGSVESAHGAQVRMLPSNKKRKFVSTPRQGTEKDLERATQAASRIELFVVTKAGGERALAGQQPQRQQDPPVLARPRWRRRRGSTSRTRARARSSGRGAGTSTRATSSA